MRWRRIGYGGILGSSGGAAVSQRWVRLTDGKVRRTPQKKWRTKIIRARLGFPSVSV